MGIHVGCCGFPLAKEKYYNHFKVVEIQQTFYQPPHTKTATRWREEAPPTFEFTLKAWQLITHKPTSPTYRRVKEKISSRRQKYLGYFQPSDEVYTAWQKTEEIAKILKATIIVFQCPAGFSPSMEHKKNLKRFFTTISRSHFTFIWEPRGSWRQEEIAELCQELGLIPCLDPFTTPPPTHFLGYFRLHGKGSYRYRFKNDDFTYLRDLTHHFTHTYFMFNNIAMYEDAKLFLKLLSNA